MHYNDDNNCYLVTTHHYKLCEIPHGLMAFYAPCCNLLLAPMCLLYTVVIGNPERHVRKASHRGSKQQ